MNPAKPVTRVNRMSTPSGTGSIEVDAPLVDSAGNSLIPALIPKPLDFILPVGSEIVVAGDSLSTNYTLAAGHDWPTYLSNFGSAGRVTMTNTAVAGRKLADLTGGYAAEVFPRRPSATGSPRTVLIAWIGINDFEVAMFNPATWWASYQAYVTQAQADGFIVCGVTITPRTDGLTPANETLRRQMNRYLRASPLLDYLVDMDRWIPAVNGALFLDQTHYVDDGRKLQAKIILSTLLGLRPLGALMDTINAGSYLDGAIQAPGPVHVFFPAGGMMQIAGAGGIARLLLDGGNGLAKFFPFAAPFAGGNGISLAAPFAAPGVDQQWTLQDAGAANANVAACVTKATTGDPAAATDGLHCVNTFDHTLKVYANGSWRQIANW